MRRLFTYVGSVSALGVLKYSSLADLGRDLEKREGFTRVSLKLRCTLLLLKIDNHNILYHKYSSI